MFVTSKLDQIVLLDFGVSKISKENNSTNMMGFSWRYSSPEVLSGEKSKVSPKSDIFSFGMLLFIFFLNTMLISILYELITGKKAWEKKN